MTEVALERPRVVPLVGERVAAGMAQHGGWGLKANLASNPARSIMRAKPAVVNGAPRSEVKTNGDFCTCSRLRRRSARSSSPRIGCVLAMPS